MALKIAHQLTRDAYDGVRKFTEESMAVESEYVAGRILEQASRLSFQIYDCCVSSCVCFTGELQLLTVCPLCNEPRYDDRQKARNRFRYIPIIPRLQAMFRDRNMIEMLLYRSKREADPKRIDDVWDGAFLRELINKNVAIDGQAQDYTYGEVDTDIFLALTCDGISIHKGIGARRSQTQYSCFPLELIILSLPPEVRTQDRFVYSLGVIPGPHEPKHLDSFCWPFYLECARGLQGIRTYHTVNRHFFPLRFYCPLSFGDLKAMIKLKGTSGVGALKPCHQCNVDSVRDTVSTGLKSKTYYVPLTIPGETENRLSDAILNNLRTHEQFEKTYHRLDKALNEAERKRIRRETGISHPCILSLLPYFNMARLVPHGFMHSVYINLFKALIRLWRGEYKNLDEGTGNFVISSAIWRSIGIETRHAVKTIPAAFVRSIPNIDTDFNSFTAEDNAFWLTWLAPYLLARRLPEPYYSHLLTLIKIIKICTGFGMTRAELKDMAADLYEWRLDYEE
jgi:Transposase family tnp2